MGFEAFFGGWLSGDGIELWALWKRGPPNWGVWSEADTILRTTPIYKCREQAEME